MATLFELIRRPIAWIICWAFILLLSFVYAVGYLIFNVIIGELIMRPIERRRFAKAVAKKDR